MNYEKIVTLFDTAQHADAARRNLEAAGFPPSDISSINNDTLTMAGDKLNEPGLWRRLFGRDIQSYEATVYGRSVQNGGVVLTVRVPETEVAKATRILNAHEAVDLQKRAVQQGLITNASAPATAAAPPPAVMAAGKSLPVETDRAHSKEEVLRLAEEQFEVGKRTVSDGATRIRRFVTVTPVEAQVTLHEEHARIIRRATTDPNYIREVDWSDKTIEVPEMAEEPVITKSVHIAEEVVIRTEGTDTVKTLKDKVRRQQVEVEKVSGDSQTTTKR